MYKDLTSTELIAKIAQEMQTQKELEAATLNPVTDWDSMICDSCQ